MPAVRPAPGIPATAYEANQRLGRRRRLRVANDTVLERSGDVITLLYRGDAHALYCPDGSVILSTPYALRRNWNLAGLRRTAAVLPLGWSLIREWPGRRPLVMYGNTWYVTLDGSITFKANGTVRDQFGGTYTQEERDRFVASEAPYRERRRPVRPRILTPLPPLPPEPPIERNHTPIQCSDPTCFFANGEPLPGACNCCDHSFGLWDLSAEPAGLATPATVPPPRPPLFTSEMIEEAVRQVASIASSTRMNFITVPPVTSD